MHPNTIGREIALQYLYMQDLMCDGGCLFDDLLSSLNNTNAKAVSFAKDLIAKVAEKKKELDVQIQETASNWKISRMSIIDRNIIRMGMVEMGSRDRRIVIDEAIELARKFGSEKSPGFVNGILDKFGVKEDLS